MSRRMLPESRPIFSPLDGAMLLAAGFSIRAIADPRSGIVQFAAAAIIVAVTMRRIYRATRCAEPER